MCGIAGQIGWDAEHIANQRPVYEAMQKTLLRRGPDQRGLYLQGNAALIHTRLCVVDIEKGRQPMRLTRGDEEYVLVYNGELYNTPELRRALERLGRKFDGHSDTEALLRAYMEWGAESIHRFNGIFAFAVWEVHNRRLFLARDRIGVKPLFYTLAGGTLLFASEIKALLAHPAVTPTLDLESVAELICLGPGRTPGCGVFRGIRELEPARCGYYTQDGLRTWRYWRLTDRENNDSFPQAVETVRFLVTDAIERQLVSDVPVGTFLSGGLDSSLISAVADRRFSARGERLHTFSVDYRDNDRFFIPGKFQPGDDGAFIRRMNGHLNAQHHQVTLDTEELVDALFEAARARDLPGMADVDASLLLFCRAVKAHVTVVLSGECADEIFGGYPWYRDPEIRARDGFPWAQSTAWRKRFLRPEHAAALDAEGYIGQRYRQTLADTSARPGLDADERRMREMVGLNFQWFMQTLLDRKDRMSMYAGLEVRVPYCDYRIAEYLYSLPWAYKDHGGVEKGLLREAAVGLLPEEVLRRKKSPYPKTHHPVYLAAVSARLRAVLADPASPLLRVADRGALETLLTGGETAPWYGQLMNTPQTIAYFLQMDYWMRAYDVEINV
ncbi:MAG: asparagine synthase (glutamine-hydrolyzing) [Oscillospiraceae bacterium]|jgi:asparagine synthase (glutamine-hydrolysing)|nr:asparagine synthase (glutamine-hydrolyzing) [Oscillospiraceae bacterium]